MLFDIEESIIDFNEQHPYKFEFDNEYHSKNIELHFLSEYTENMLDIFDDLKKRFSLNPDFLCDLKSTQFIDFISTIILYNKYTHKVNFSENDLIYFYNIYNKEIDISYHIVNKFVKTFKIDLDCNNWIQFCCKNSYITNYY